MACHPLPPGIDTDVVRHLLNSCIIDPPQICPPRYEEMFNQAWWYRHAELLILAVMLVRVSCYGNADTGMLVRVCWYGNADTGMLVRVCWYGNDDTGMLVRVGGMCCWYAMLVQACWYGNAAADSGMLVCWYGNYGHVGTDTKKNTKCTTQHFTW